VTQPFFCIITPIFDPALGPAKLLIRDILNQSFENFCHVFISNGESPQTRQFIRKLRDSRFIYDEIPFQPTSTQKDLVCNIGKRREHCLKKYVSKRFLFLNADLKLLDDTYFQKLSQAHPEADVLVTQVLNRPNGGRGTILPKRPIQIGTIDASNFSVSQKVAKERSWPTDFHPIFRIANDYRYFQGLVERYSVKFLPFISAEKDGHNMNSYGEISQMG
jgi:hypothetical protein